MGLVPSLNKVNRPFKTIEKNRHFKANEKLSILSLFPAQSLDSKYKRKKTILTTTQTSNQPQGS